MTKNYKQGFSLAEALIALVIISLVMAATMPIVIKAQNSPSEAPWKYITQGDLSQNAAVYSALGLTSPIVLGAKRVPMDSNTTTSKDYVFANKLNPKIILVARNNTNNPLISRHLIDFFEEETTGYTAIGKISFDKYFNMALGQNAMDTAINTSANPQKIVFDTINTKNDWNNIKMNSTDIIDIELPTSTPTKGAANTAIGQYSMGGDVRYSGVSGSGASATDLPTRNLTGVGNTALGAFSMRRHRDGNFNTGLGIYALESSGDTAAAVQGKGSHNTAVGAKTLKHNLEGNYNTVMGSYAMIQNVSGSSNVVIGMNSMINNKTGSKNTVIGSGALKQNKTGSNNIAIGYQAGSTAIEGSSNKLYIDSVKTTDDALIYGDCDAGARTLKINAKTTTLGVDAGSQTIIFGSGYITNGGTPDQIVTQTQLNSAVSDARLKNITGDYSGGLSEIVKLQVKNFTFKNDKKKEPRVGVIAQELQKIFPQSVIEGRDGYLRIKRDEMFYSLINAVKELNDMIKDTIAKITGLDERVRLLEARNKINEEKIDALEKQYKLLEEKINTADKKSIKKDKPETADKQ